MKDFKRVVSLLLVFVLLLGVLPANALALGFDDAQQAMAEAPMAGLGAPPVAAETPTEETTQETIATEAVEETTEATEAADAATETTEATEEVTEATEETTEATEETAEETTEATEETLPEDALLTMEGIPMAFAADGTIYLLAGGDFQEGNSDGTTLHVNSAENVSNILDEIYADGYTMMHGMLFVGDYDGTDHNNATKVANGITSLMSTVQEKYTNISDANTILVQGNHDNMDSRIDATGGHDFDGYSVFVLNEDDYVNGGGSESGTKALAAKMEAWLNEKIADGFEDPIFVTAHLPLAFSPRTNVQGDGVYAKYLFDVLNNAGAAGLNIIYLHGHDHAYGCDNYLGGEAIYRAKGDELYIAKAGSRTEYTVETLNFTYMNAGYTGYYNETGYDINERDDSKLTMTVFAIADGEVSVARYSADGEYNLSSKGRDGYYNNTSVTASSLGLEYNQTVYSSPQTIELTSPVHYTVTDAATGITVTSRYTEEQLGLQVTADVDVAALNDTNKYAGYEAYTASANVSGEAASNFYATVTIPVPTEYPLDGTIVYQVNSDGTLTELEAEITMVAGQKVASFQTQQPGTFAVAVKNSASSGGNLNGWTEISTDVSGYEYTLDTDGLDNGSANKYIIVAEDLPLALYATSTANSTAETISISADGKTAIVPTRNYEYYFVNTYGFTKDGSNGLYQQDYYVRYGKKSASYLDGVINNNDGTYCLWDNEGNYRGLYYSTSNSRFTVGGDNSTYSNYAVRLYKYKGELTAETGYAKLTGESAYKVPYGTSEADALAAVKAGITGVKADDTNGTNQSTISDADLTWTWNSTYNGNSGGSTYEIAVSYNGVSLGTVAVEVEEQKAPAATAGNYVDISQAGNSNYTYTLDTDGVNTDSGYLIVGSGNAQAMTGTSGSLGSTGVTISGNTAEIATPNHEWKIDSNNRIYTTSGNTTYYLKFTGSYSFGGSATGSLSLVTRASDATTWDISNSQGNYTVSVDYVYGSYYQRTATFYLRYNSNTFNVTTGSNTVRLYGGRQDPVASSSEYAIAEGDKLYTVSTGATAAQALAKVKEGITVSTATDVNGTNKTAVNDADVTWTWVDTYSTTPGYYTVEISYEGKSLGTVEVQVAESGEGNLNGWVQTQEAGSYYQYILDTDGMESGSDNRYLVVGDDEEIALTVSGNNVGNTSITVNGDTALTTTRDYEFYFQNNSQTENNTFLLTQNGTRTVYHGGGALNYGSHNRGYWYVNHVSNGNYQVYDYDNNNWYLNYGVVWENEAVNRFAVSSNSHNVRLYKYDDQVTIKEQYASIEGKTSYNVTAGTMTEAQILAMIQKEITGYQADDANGTNKTTLLDSQLTWTWVDEINPDAQGYYTMAISYNGKELGTVEVFVEKKAISYFSVEPKTGYVSQNASQAAIVQDANGDPIYVTTHYVDGSTSKTALTVGMLSDDRIKIDTSSSGTRSGLLVTYSGHEIANDFTLKILERVVNDYPEYPEEGAVKVSKSGTGIDFQASGIARVELSASGIPVKKGADVILMLDTSSSMTSHTITGGSKTRAAVLEESLVNLIDQFKQPGEDNELLDLRVAIADFNGFYGDNQSASGTPYDRDAEDMMSDDISYNASSEAKVYTGNGTLSAGAFVDAKDLASSYTLNYTSGTNYDYAMDAIYQLGTAIKQQNMDNNEDRDLYVIFMSDGAAMQWNYYHSQGASALWNNWICGNWGVDDLSLNCTAHAYYYNAVDTDGDGMQNEHRMANAIKGDPNSQFAVIRKTAGLGTPTEQENIYMVPGLGAKMFAISFDATTDNKVTEESMDLSIETLASEQTGSTQYYYKVTSAAELERAFSSIGNEIAYAATNARFVDQMGDDYNLQLKTATYEVVENGAKVAKTLAPVIEILSYDIYTRQDFENGIIPEDRIGVRKGTSHLLEVVKFSDDGTKAYSNKVDVDKDGTYGVTVNADGSYTISDTGDNILGTDGVILASTFMYNTGTLETTVNGIALASEQFYWKLGTVQTSELAMRYYVYLEGSMEGTRPAGSYPTNESAILYYDNYLGNPCYKETVSPVMAWQAANVSYAFYLVDENGNIIVNQTTGETGTFANKIEVTRPVVYKEIYLNNLDQVTSLDVAAASENVLPKYYTLYDNAAVYKVTINSNSTGSWEITKGNDVKASTYVTQYKTDDASAYSNALTNNSIGDDYTHTVVWFAVVWSVQPHPDTVVIDYGLPVDISVLTNDMFGDYGKLAAIGAYSDNLNLDGHDTTLADGFGATWQGVYGAAEANVDTGKVRYTIGGQIDEENKITQVPGIMKMDGYEKFAYAVSYNGASNAGYYYDTITVIPATTIYYEDSFLTLSGSNTNWEEEGTYDGTGVQDEDRPGEYSLTDANNIYGYDGVNLGMSTYSLGTAKKVHVDADSYAKANFTFAGTGFDVISMTSNTTGVLAVKVSGEKLEKPKTFVINNYYGYDYCLCNVVWKLDEYTGEWIRTITGKADETAQESKADYENAAEGVVEVSGVEYAWVATPDEANALYQVPVIKIEDLPYGVYDVEFTATYATALDQTTEDGYWLYLDAIRIYDPANDGAADGSEDKTIEDVYVQDGEGWPSYIELRNQLLSEDDLLNYKDGDNTIIEGVVFIDGDPEVGNAQIGDYISYGPNNEVYLAPNQYVAFMLGDAANAEIANVHIGIKSADGGLGTYTITNIARQDIGNLKKGDYYGARTEKINTTTDMYYDLTGWKNDIIVICNTGGNSATTGLISLTNIKFTYKSNPQATQNMSAAADEPAVAAVAVEMPMNNGEAYLYMTPAAANVAVHAINQEAEKDEDKDDPDKEDDLPIIPIPGVTEPEESIPETTEPEESVPETTVPETTVPDEEEPEEFDPFVYATLSSKSVKVGNSVLVTVTTDNNVTALSINGKAVTRYTDNLWSGKRIWVDSVKANKIGEMPIEVLAYSAEGEAAEPVIKTVNVTKKSTSIIDAFFGWLFK